MSAKSASASSAVAVSQHEISHSRSPRCALPDASTCRRLRRSRAQHGVRESSSASSTSLAVTMYGGSSRTTVVAVRLTSRPRSSAALTTGAASLASSRPAMRPAPRTSVTICGCRAAQRAQAREQMRGRRARSTSCRPRSSASRNDERRAAREQVAAVRRAVIAGRDRLRRPFALHHRGADRHAGAERLAERDEIGREADRRAVRGTCPVRPTPLCTSSAISSAPVRAHAAAIAVGQRRRNRPHAALALNRLDDDRRPSSSSTSARERGGIGRVGERHAGNQRLRTARGSARPTSPTASPSSGRGTRA